MAPLHALLASPTFSGAVTLPDLNVQGRFNCSIELLIFSAAGNAFNLDVAFMKKINVSGDYTGACTATNITSGDIAEVHMTNTKGTDAVLLWDPSWVWMGYAPSVLPSGKKAVLSLRVPTGHSAADVIAMWSVEP